ncbi:MAG: hypothetical protein HXY24_10150 [Rubrivivax sp.]|nr:hypothetical protein [Rubrivivax sp.]
MSLRPPEAREAAARVLALILAVDGRADPREIDALADDRALARLGVSAERFVELAREYEAEAGSRRSTHNYLHLSDIERLDALLAQVLGRELRLLVCALAARVITADGSIRDIERMVFDHMLARWGLTRSMVSRAILAERATAPSP